MLCAKSGMNEFPPFPLKGADIQAGLDYFDNENNTVTLSLRLTVNVSTEGHMHRLN